MSRSQQVEDGTSGAVRIDTEAADRLREDGEGITFQHISIMQDEAMVAAGQQTTVGAMVEVKTPPLDWDRLATPDDYDEDDDEIESSRKTKKRKLVHNRASIMPPYWVDVSSSEIEDEEEVSVEDASEEEGVGEEGSGGDSAGEDGASDDEEDDQGEGPLPRPDQPGLPLAVSGNPTLIPLMPREDVDDTKDPSLFTPGQTFTKEYKDQWKHIYNFHHPGRGSWILGLPAPGSNTRMGVQGPDAATWKAANTEKGRKAQAKSSS